ncbi:MAG: carbamoyltransferase HypF [Sedimentibacter sp.]|uniref:carbamoyltransferase HypF n=1 Tax=Sedimentibacter sp. TaxID=1960295 RepID=UPI00315986ED
MNSDEIRYQVMIYGVVQGVGFRPFIYNQAEEYNIKGWVSNQGSAVVMDIEGKRKNIKEFLLQAVKNPPSLARVEKVTANRETIIGYENFKIIQSLRNAWGPRFIGSDVAVCPDCLKEISDPQNRRFGYAFTNCTNCGPRYSLAIELPYDRENTTMDFFGMCTECLKEYNDPSNRRFHAQTNCCPACGPVLILLNKAGEEIMCSNPAKKAAEFLKDGKIIAVKGIGGFHLVCDAFSKDAVTLLRKRKNRLHKPFAVMVRDMDTAKKLCFMNEKEEKALSGSRKPIVLLDKKQSDLRLPDQIAPGLKKLGIMLPYTPLHHLLFQDGLTCLVMTSGNLSSAPIQYENKKAVENLKIAADYFMLHNRDINVPVEDSVVKITGNEEHVVRSARGYTPFIFPMKSNLNVLALGAEEKSTFCFLKNNYLYMSQYIGDLKNYDTYVNYDKAIKNLKSLLEFEPEAVAHDLHSSYESSQYAKTLGLRPIKVQHHHAHMVSCMVEHNLYNPVIGVIFDGTGLGADNNMWGGEFLVGNRESFIRAGHFCYATIQGGDRAVGEPWRIAVSYLHAMNHDFTPMESVIGNGRIDMVKQAIENRLNCYETSSVGRLFDCAASLLDVRQCITYDGQAAIELENIIDPSVQEEYPCSIEELNGIYKIDSKSILMSVIKDIQRKTPSSVISARFHNTIVCSSSDVVTKISKDCGLKTVVLSGGVFENSHLLLNLADRLKRRGFTVYSNHKIPTNDSGICAGQAAIADAQERK